MYRFQVSARTRTGECIGLVGSTPELGLWDTARCIRLRTSGALYPLWWTDARIELQPSPAVTDCGRVEYKYVRLGPNGSVQWEAPGPNRWVPLGSGRRSRVVVVDDGTFGRLQSPPFGYIEGSSGLRPPEKFEGLKIVVIGSSVAAGHKAWLSQGWAWLLAKALQQKYGHQLVNVSEPGTNVGSTIGRFAAVVAPEKPDVVVIALSLGNEGFAHCPARERQAVQDRFENGLRRLVEMARESGAHPILGGIYPNGDYSPAHNQLLRDTHARMLEWGVPVLDWLAAVDDGRGRWKPGTFFDPAHPNTVGHRLMYEAIDLRLFRLDKHELELERQRFKRPTGVPVYLDSAGFSITGCAEQKCLRISNPSQYSYIVSPDWRALQTALRHKAGLVPGLYLAQNARKGVLPFFDVREDGTIETALDVLPGADLEYTSARDFLAHDNPKLLFREGCIAILKEDEHRLWVINESDHEYNIHPMWLEVRAALKAVPPGVYQDPIHPDAPFRTMMIGLDGLESRVRVPPRAAVLFEYQCKLSEVDRVAIVPLGDRCAVRMLLYKLGYDGPAFPFDLTRTTEIGDVADLIETRFQGMWDPASLYYDADAARVRHTRWTGLSFAHEVEATDDPFHHMSTIHERMRVRYTARCERFWYTIERCDRLLFVRTGATDRGGAWDLIVKLEKQCQGKPFQLLIISAQSSDEFAGLFRVLHYNLEFNPDRMYEDPGHWLHCTEVMGDILESLDISSKNLFWCPPNPPLLVS